MPLGHDQEPHCHGRGEVDLATLTMWAKAHVTALKAHPDVRKRGAIIDAARAMAAPYLAVIDRLQKAPLTPGARPWVPIVPPLTAAAELPAEKTEVGSQAIDIPGSVVQPTGVGDAENIAWAAFQTDELRDTLLAVIVGRTIAGIVADLAATTSIPASITAAIGQSDAAGYPPTLIVTDRGKWLSTAGVVPQSGSTYSADRCS